MNLKDYNLESLPKDLRLDLRESPAIIISGLPSELIERIYEKGKELYLSIQAAINEEEHNGLRLVKSTQPEKRNLSDSIRDSQVVQVSEEFNPSNIDYSILPRDVVECAIDIDTLTRIVGNSLKRRLSTDYVRTNLFHYNATMCPHMCHDNGFIVEAHQDSGAYVLGFMPQGEPLDFRVNSNESWQHVDLRPDQAILLGDGVVHRVRDIHNKDRFSIVSGLSDKKI